MRVLGLPDAVVQRHVLCWGSVLKQTSSVATASEAAAFRRLSIPRVLSFHVIDSLGSEISHRLLIVDLSAAASDFSAPFYRLFVKRRLL